MAKIHRAARKGDLAAVVSLLDAGTDVDTPEKITGATLMHVAIGNASMEMAQLLLDRGADLSAQSVVGTPLHFAKTPETARFLLAHGVEVDVRSKSGMTPLHDAAQAGNAEMVRFFLENGADIDAKTENGKMPLDFAQDPEVKEVLEAKGGATKEPTKFEAWTERSAAGWQVIKLAERIRKGDEAGVRELLDQGVSPKDTLWNALAGDTDNEAVVDSALVSAILGGNRMSLDYSKIARTLIDAGADVNVPSEHGPTAEAWKQLWETFPPVAIHIPYTPAFSLSDLFMEDDSTPPVVSPHTTGFAPIHVAAMNNEPLLLAALLSNGADPDARLAGGETPLHMAALFAAPQAASVLLEAGADANARTTEADETPLAWAVRRTQVAEVTPEGKSDLQSVAGALAAHGGIA